VARPAIATECFPQGNLLPKPQIARFPRPIEPNVAGSGLTSNDDLPPAGAQLEGGTLYAELSISGSINKLAIAGSVRLANTKLAGFDLGSKLSALSAFSGKTPPNRDTSIQNASLNARVAPEGTKADAINVTVPVIGVITGAGTISPNGVLDFRMLADLQGGVAGGLAQRAGRENTNGIPFSIQGNTSDPRFVPDVGSVAGSAARGRSKRQCRERPVPRVGCSGREGRSTTIASIIHWKAQFE
jgi:hypothetical protein